MKLVSRNRLAEKVTGGLSITQKMPCPSWGIPALRCKLGSILAQRDGTVCRSCYALKGRYRFSHVQQKLEERYRGLFQPLWTPAIAFLVNYHCNKYFRLFDSGDLQSENHLLNINTMALATPEVRIWMPTREAVIVRAVKERIGEFAPNLLVRLSGHWIDGQAPDWPTTSTVATEAHREAQEGSYACPSRLQGNSCGACRACWSPSVPNVVYQLH